MADIRQPLFLYAVSDDASLLVLMLQEVVYANLFNVIYVGQTTPTLELVSISPGKRALRRRRKEYENL